MIAQAFLISDGEEATTREDANGSTGSGSNGSSGSRERPPSGRREPIAIRRKRKPRMSASIALEAAFVDELDAVQEGVAVKGLQGGQIEGPLSPQQRLERLKMLRQASIERVQQLEAHKKAAREAATVAAAEHTTAKAAVEARQVPAEPKVSQDEEVPLTC